MSRVTTRTIARTSIALAAAAATLTIASGPASAHTLASAVVSGQGCDWPNGNYTILHSDPITVRRSGGADERLGTAYLLWNAQYGQNCSVALRTGGAHGVSTRTEAVLWVGTASSYRTYKDAGNYDHYAAVSAPAANRCVSYYAWIDSPRTGLVGGGGRTTFGNCD